MPCRQLFFLSERYVEEIFSCVWFLKFGKASFHHLGFSISFFVFSLLSCLFSFWLFWGKLWPSLGHRYIVCSDGTNAFSRLFRPPPLTLQRTTWACRRCRASSRGRRRLATTSCCRSSQNFWAPWVSWWWDSFSPPRPAINFRLQPGFTPSDHVSWKFCGQIIAGRVWAVAMEAEKVIPTQLNPLVTTHIVWEPLYGQDNGACQVEGMVSPESFHTLPKPLHSEIRRAWDRGVCPNLFN